MGNWKEFQEEQQKITEAMAKGEFETSDLAKELTKQLQEGFAAGKCSFVLS